MVVLVTTRNSGSFVKYFKSLRISLFCNLVCNIIGMWLGSDKSLKTHFKIRGTLKDIKYTKRFFVICFTYYVLNVLIYKFQHYFDWGKIVNYLKLFFFRFETFQYYQLGHNILRVFDVLLNFPFSTSEVKRAWLLLINVVYMSCLTSCRTT